MPEMDGFEFMDVLYQRDMAHRIPVVVITSEDLGDEARSRLAQRGVRQVLPKSAYPKEKLVGIVRDLALRLPSGTGK
jgi:CheY-like chemotaxis protein